MRIVRIKLLITLILVTIAAIAVSSPASAYRVYDRSIDPSWIHSSSLDDGLDLNGEPEVGGNTAPTSGGKSYGARQQRTEAPVRFEARYRLWLSWMSRIWAARNWGVPF